MIKAFVLVCVYVVCSFPAFALELDNELNSEMESEIRRLLVAENDADDLDESEFDEADDEELDLGDDDDSLAELEEEASKETSASPPPVAKQEKAPLPPPPPGVDQAPEPEAKSGNMVETTEPQAPAKKLKSGFKRLKIRCPMRSIASVEGREIKQIKKGKKLWTETYSNGWTKVFRKKGEAFVSNDCFL